MKGKVWKIGVVLLLASTSLLTACSLSLTGGLIGILLSLGAATALLFSSSSCAGNVCLSIVQPGDYHVGDDDGHTDDSRAGFTLRSERQQVIAELQDQLPEDVARHLTQDSNQS